MKKQIVGITCEDLNRRFIEEIMKSPLFERLPNDKQTDLMKEIAGPSTSSTPYISLEWRYAWAVSVNLYTSFNFYKSERIEGTEIHWYQPKIELSWSSTSRSPSTARASINLYTQATDLACLMQAISEEKPAYKSFAYKSSYGE